MARIRSRFESDPRTQRQLGCVALAIGVLWAFATIIGALSRVGGISPFVVVQLAFATLIGVTAVSMLWRGLHRPSPPVVLEITDDGLHIDRRLTPWSEIAHVELVREYPIPPGPPAGVLAAMVSVVHLRVRLIDGSMIPISRSVLGTEPLGPWDEVVDAIHRARPTLPIIDSAGAQPLASPPDG